MSGEKIIKATGLNSPEGLAVAGQDIFVFEGGTGKIKVINESNVQVIAEMPAGSPAASAEQPPSMVFNGLASRDGYIYVADEIGRSIYRINYR